MGKPQRHRRGGKGDKGRTLGLTLKFRTEEGKIDPDLFDRTAQEAAKRVADCNRNMNKSTQLRKFYDELAMWQEKAAQNPDRFDDFLPFVRMLKAKAAYAEGRELVDRAFVELLNQTVDLVKTADDLRLAKLFLEAFSGFYRLEKGDS